MRTGIAMLIALAIAQPAAAEPPGVAEQRPGTFVQRLAARPLMDVGLLPRLSYESAMAWDSRAKRVVMWGGHELRTDSPQQDETWLYDPAANTWTESQAPRRPVGSCCVRDMCYDSLAGRVVQFEGHHGNHGWQLRRGMQLRTSTPWLYDAAADRWTPMRPPFGPRGRPYKMLAYSPDHQVSLLYGGEGSYNDTWAYDSYTNTWYDLNPATRPPQRLGGGMAYDRKHRLFVLHGSSGYQNLNDTWTFDIEKNQWKELKSAAGEGGAAHEGSAALPAPGASPILVYDEVAEQVLCFYSKTGEPWKMHVWALDIDKRAWTEVTPPGEAGPQYYDFCVAYVPELNVHVIGPGHANWDTGHPTVRQTWTYRHKAGTARRDPPGLTGDPATAARSVRLSGPRLSGTPDAAPIPKVTLYRAEGELPWKLTWSPIGEPRYPWLDDDNVERGAVYHYRLKWDDRFGPPSRAQPAVPVCPLVAPTKDKVELSWPANPAGDIAGYNVYRATVKVKAASVTAIDQVAGFGPWVKVNAELLKEPTYTDPVDLTVNPPAGYKFAVYAYNVRAINRLGVESGPSPWALTLPEQSDLPELVAAEPGKVTLRWKAHPSPAVVGYHVWRMTRSGGRGEQVTAEPIKATEFTDTLPGSGMRRYWVLAVDALGQEGITSAGVWAFRGAPAAPLD